MLIIQNLFLFLQAVKIDRSFILLVFVFVESLLLTFIQLVVVSVRVLCLFIKLVQFFLIIFLTVYCINFISSLGYHRSHVTCYIHSALCSCVLITEYKTSIWKIGSPKWILAHWSSLLSQIRFNNCYCCIFSDLIFYQPFNNIFILNFHVNCLVQNIF